GSVRPQRSRAPTREQSWPACWIRKVRFSLAVQTKPPPRRAGSSCSNRSSSSLQRTKGQQREEGKHAPTAGEARGGWSQARSDEARAGSHPQRRTLEAADSAPRREGQHGVRRGSAPGQEQRLRGEVRPEDAEVGRGVEEAAAAAPRCAGQPGGLRERLKHTS